MGGLLNFLRAVAAELVGACMFGNLLCVGQLHPLARGLLQFLVHLADGLAQFLPPLLSVGGRAVLSHRLGFQYLDALLHLLAGHSAGFLHLLLHLHQSEFFGLLLLVVVEVLLVVVAHFRGVLHLSFLTAPYGSVGKGLAVDVFLQVFYSPALALILTRLLAEPRAVGVSLLQFGQFLLHLVELSRSLLNLLLPEISTFCSVFDVVVIHRHMLAQLLVNRLSGGGDHRAFHVLAEPLHHLVGIGEGSLRLVGLALQRIELGGEFLYLCGHVVKRAFAAGRWVLNESPIRFQTLDGFVELVHAGTVKPASLRLCKRRLLFLQLVVLLLHLAGSLYAELIQVFLCGDNLLC